MDPILETVFQLLSILFLVGAFLWLAVPVASGLPWVPAHRQRIRAALRLAGVKPGETVYDLGAGDGRVLVLAAREFGAQAVGVEISPVHCLLALLRVGLAGVSRQVKIRWGNFYQADLSSADVIFAYVTTSQAGKLRESLEARLKPGTRVVTVSSDLDGWQPTAIDRKDLVFLYHIPPIAGSIATFLVEDFKEA